MGKNKKIKKVILLLLYCVVLFLWIFDLLCCRISIKLQVMHYDIYNQLIYGKTHLTYFTGVYEFACMLFTIIPIFWFVFLRKTCGRFFLCVALFALHLIIGVACAFWMYGMDNDGTYDEYGEFSSFENTEKGVRICVQNVYMGVERGHSIIVLQTGVNTLKKIKECNFTIYTYKVPCNWGKDRVTIYSESWNDNDDILAIDISYDELKKAGAYID